MARKPTYEKLEQRVSDLEREVARCEQVNQALRHSEEKYRTLVNDITDGLFVTDDKGTITFVNKALAEMHGYKRPQQVVGRHFSGLILPEARNEISEIFNKAVKTGRFPRLLEIPVVRKDGTNFLIQLKASVLMEEGRIVGTKGVNRDITDRKREEEALRESKERFRQIAELSPFPISVIDSDGRYLYLNKKFTEIFGYALDDIPTGRDWFHKAYPDPEYRRKVISVWKSDLEKFGKYQVRPREFSVICKAGTVREIIFMPISMDNGKQFIIYEDLTDRKQAQEALQKAHDELEKRVEERTSELTKMNRELKLEIAERKQAERKLKEKEAELRSKTNSLKEVNTALRVLLKRREEDKGELEEKVLSNVKDLVLPYVERLKKTRLDTNQMSCLDILESNLDDIVSPFARTLSSKYLDLTPTEIRVAHLVKDGKTTKEIAEFMHLSAKTIEFHRDNVRKKLGIKGKKVNLRTQLLSM